MSDRERAGPTHAKRRIWIEPPAGATSAAAPDAAAAAPERAPDAGMRTLEQDVRVIVEGIRKHAGRELGVPPAEVPVEATFFDMGADSLLMVNVVRHVEQTFDVTVTMRELFEQADSPIALARLVASRMPREPATEDLGQVGDETAAEGRASAPAGTPAPAATPPVEHGPQVEVDREGGMGGGALTPAQRRHLDRLVSSLTARTRGSKELAQRFRPRLADVRASIGFRSRTKELLYPIATRSASGAHVQDVDGNDYVDITMGFGVLLFGHEPAFVREAVAEHLARGIQLGSRTEDAGVVAELLCELTGVERVAFAGSGTEAISAAIRVARAATGRDKLVLFRDAYHGHFDGVLARGAAPTTGRTAVPVSPGIPQSAVDDVVVLEYDDEHALERIAELGERIAAVLVEPVQSRHPDRQPREFLTRLRALTQRLGIVLIFDEMLTGFRAHLGGAQAVFGVRADLVTYGKVLGGGFPIGVVAGRRDLMDHVDGGDWRYGDDSRPECETAFFAGTYMQHPVAMAAARATLLHLREQGPGLQERLNASTDRLAARLNAVFAAEEYPLRVVHFGSLFRFALERDLELLFPHMLLEGVFVWEWRNFCLSTAHDEDDVAHVERAVTSSLAELRGGGWLPARRGAASAARVDGAPASAAPRFSVYYFGAYPRETPAEERYELLFESARFADEAGFHALWIPERHFHAFGGVFPNPSVLAAALARETRRIRLHAGSVVLPLHDAIRVAEEWSVVDNLSGGRVGIGVASGWHANDFALRPGAFGRHKELMYEQLERVKALWRGDAVEAVSGTGERIAVTLHPPPLQAQPPLFTAILGSPESYERAGAHDLGVITNLMTQDVDQLAANVARYRAARAAAGLDPAAGSVVVLLHTYLATTERQARAEAFDPFCAYLRSSLSLLGQVTNSLGMNIDLEHTSDEDVDYMLGRAFESYCDTRALIGTVDSCERIVRQLVGAGVDEIACFVDFGVSRAQLRASLPHMAALRERFAAGGAAAGGAADAVDVVEAPAASQEPAWEGESSPLALAQERMWFTHQLHSEHRGYNEPVSIRLTGPLDRAALTAALDDVVRAQSTLRCRIVEEGGVPRQRIRRHVEVELPAIDVAGRPEQEVVVEQMELESARRFDLAHGPLWLARLLRFDDEHHVLVLSFHHIVIDMISMRCLMRQLSRCYAAQLRGEPSPFAEGEPPRYVDYARDQREQLASPEVEAALRYWGAHLAPLPPPLVLPTDHPRPEIPSGAGTSHFHRLDRELTARLDAHARSSQVTPFMCLTSAYAIALSSLSGQEEILIGTPIADRPLRFAETIGPFINALPLRIDLRGAETFAAVLGRVRSLMLDALEHQAAPFEEIVRRVNPPRDADRNPLFQVMIEFGGGASHELDLPGVEAAPLDVAPSRSAFDLTLRLWPRGEEMQCELEYSTALFEPATIAGLAARFDAIVRAGLADVERPLTEVLAVVSSAGERPAPRDGATTAAMERVLRASPAVADVAVLPWTDQRGERALAAYVAPAEAAAGVDDRTLLAELGAQLARELPDHDPPVAWSLLTRLPRNARDELDRAALPEPAVADLDGAPDGDPSAGERLSAAAVEAFLQQVWREELELETVEATASFFDLGGQSLNAIRIVNRVNERFAIEYPILDFLGQPTIRATAALIVRLAGNGTTDLLQSLAAARR